MNFQRSDSFPACEYTDPINYQSKLLLIECSDGTFELGFLIGSAADGSWSYVNKRFEKVKCLAWAAVNHSEFYNG